MRDDIANRRIKRLTRRRQKKTRRRKQTGDLRPQRVLEQGPSGKKKERETDRIGDNTDVDGGNTISEGV